MTGGTFGLFDGLTLHTHLPVSVMFATVTITESLGVNEPLVVLEEGEFFNRERSLYWAATFPLQSEMWCPVFDRVGRTPHIYVTFIERFVHSFI